MDLLRCDETLDDLNLKGISVIQKKHAFRFGIDAVLLANYAKVKKGQTVADFCTGTGIVPFILAGKTEAAFITGVEIQEEMVDMGNRSITYNKIEHRISIIQGDIKDKKLIDTIGKVDIVTVNPPYKHIGTGIINENDKNAIARHEIYCNLEDVIVSSMRVLKDNGKLYMVHRPERLADIFSLMRKHRMEPKRVRMVSPSVGKPPNIVLIEAQKYGGQFLKWEPELFVHEKNGDYTKDIDDIYGR